MIEDRQITFLIPAKQEKESLGYVLNELKNYNFKIIVILELNDLETFRVAKKFKNSIIKQKNSERGYGAAILKGLKKVKTEYFCIFNADGSFNPSEIKNMKQKLLLGNFDIIFASRYLGYNSGSDDDSFLTWIGNQIFTFLGRIIYRIKISDILYTFILAKTDKIKNLKLKSNDFRLCVEIPIKAKINNLKFTDCTSYERKRYSGKKKVNEFKDGFLILIYIFKFFLIKKFNISRFLSASFF